MDPAALFGGPILHAFQRSFFPIDELIKEKRVPGVDIDDVLDASHFFQSGSCSLVEDVSSLSQYRTLLLL